MQKLIVAKQASDLHTNDLSQRIIQRFLLDNDIDAHIARITGVYGRQRDAMVEGISAHLPADIDFTSPSGGMFIWATLPDNLSATRLFERAIEQKVAFVPGKPFYIDRASTSTLRLNFSCADGPTIDVGIRRLGAALNGLANE